MMNEWGEKQSVIRRIDAESADGNEQETDWARQRTLPAAAAGDPKEEVNEKWKTVRIKGRDELRQKGGRKTPDGT